MLSIAFLKVLLTKSVIVKTIRDLITSENKALIVQEQLVIVDKLLTTTFYFRVLNISVTLFLASVTCIIFIEFLWVFECLPLLRLTIEKPCLLRIFESFF